MEGGGRFRNKLKMSHCFLIQPEKQQLAEKRLSKKCLFAISEVTKVSLHTWCYKNGGLLVHSRFLLTKAMKKCIYTYKILCLWVIAILGFSWPSFFGFNTHHWWSWASQELVSYIFITDTCGMEKNIQCMNQHQFSLNVCTLMIAIIIVFNVQIV